MNIQHEITLRTSNSPLKQIALMMGYSNRKAPEAATRIGRVLEDHDLGLDSGGYDFKYSDSEFVLKLCDVLGLDPGECLDQVKMTVDKIWTRKTRYRPWLFVDTNFRRTTQPVFVLAVLESRRRIQLPDMAGLPLYEQIERVKSVIVQHYQDNDGELMVWGTIQKYFLQYSEEEHIAFSPDGDILVGEHDFIDSRAFCTVGRTDLAKLIDV